ncbi:MAG: cysteine--tRNA ligase [Planctomycetota bacterium]|nr:cysteine--tRNA ligase [Planctomycetota bacterium]
MTLHLYNTLTRRKEEFRPIREGEAGLYTCGPTVYDVAHIGNMRAFLTFDLLRRTLELRGYKVRHVLNLTDVDDRIIQGLSRENLSLEEYTAKYTELFFADMDRMKILRAHENPRATEHIDAMITLIKRLEEKGLTYEANGSTYFSVSKFAEYGKLSGMSLDQLQSTGRVDSDQYEKEEARDFALWKAWTEADGPVVWETALGRGRPGWHIECSAMSMQYLGETFDLHAGGVDLIFPHHENEIAQSEGATGQPFVRTWIHNEMLLVEGEKMSKSKGNFTILDDIFQKGFEGRHVRYAYLQAHYRQPFNFTWKGMEQAVAAIEGLEDFRLRVREAPGDKQNEALDPLLKKGEKAFDDALDDDLNSARAIAALHTFVSDANRVGFSSADAPRVEAFLSRTDSVLGILGEAEEAVLTKEQTDLLELREAARTRKDFDEADRLRNLLREKGLEIRDGSLGTTWRRTGDGGPSGRP